MLKKVLVFCFLISLATASSANLLQTGFKIEYDVNYNGMALGVSKRSLLFLSDQKAIYKSETVPEGFASLIIKETIKEVSKVNITRNEIKPTQYVITKNKRGKIEENKIDFNWQAKTVTNSYSKKTDALQQNTHDLLSFQLNIMRDLQQNKKTMLYQVATKKHSRLYTLKTENEELIETSLGDFNTVKLSSKSSEGNSQFIFWCSPELEYLPIKFQKVNDKGDVFSFTLRTFETQK